MDFAGAASVAAAVAAVAAAAGSGLVAWTGPVDSPNARSSHDIPTVTTGGLAIVAGAAMGLAAFALLAGAAPELAVGALTLAFAAALGAFGAFDDLYDYGARPKLAIQAAAALAFAAVVAPVTALPLPGVVVHLPAVLGIGGAALWLVTVTNAVNFMDGADGLAAGCMAIALAALAAGCLAAAPGIAATALVAAAALVGFLPWNLPSKRLFQGDVGSLFSGFLVAALGLAAYSRGAAGLYLVPFALTPFLADVLLTLSMRSKRGERLFEAHRDHLYQLWLRRTGRSHAALAIRGFGLTAIYALAGLAAERTAPELQPLLWILGFLVAAAGWKLMRRKLEG
jgi:UDP-N-acetylmuramyl pentapeptide phosphotransferase/UDP-N-acetylglucosamine-1-phosphate transferase